MKIYPIGRIEQGVGEDLVWLRRHARRRRRRRRSPAYNLNSPPPQRPQPVRPIKLYSAVAYVLVQYPMVRPLLPSLLGGNG